MIAASSEHTAAAAGPATVCCKVPTAALSIPFTSLLRALRIGVLTDERERLHLKYGSRAGLL